MCARVCVKAAKLLCRAVMVNEVHPALYIVPD